MSTTLYYSPNYIRPIIPLCLIKYFHANIDAVDIATKQEEFSKEFPLKKCPALINKAQGIYLTETIAICNYIIKTFAKEPEEIKKLLGSTILEESEILRWESFSVSDFLNREVEYIGPLIGMMPYDAVAHEKAKKAFDVVVQIYEDHLKNHRFLVGDHITLADLTAACCFYLGFGFAFDENWSKQYPNITRWYKEVTKSEYVNSFFFDKKPVKAFPQPPK